LTGAPIFLRGTSETVNVTEQSSLSQTLDIFPNPTQRYFHLSVEGMTAADLKVEVLNVIGEAVEQRSFVYNGAAAVYDFDCADWATGTYFVKIRSAEGVEAHKVVIE